MNNLSVASHSKSLPLYPPQSICIHKQRNDLKFCSLIAKQAGENSANAIKHEFKSKHKVLCQRNMEKCEICLELCVWPNKALWTGKQHISQRHANDLLASSSSSSLSATYGGEKLGFTDSNRSIALCSLLRIHNSRLIVVITIVPAIWSPVLCHSSCFGPFQCSSPTRQMISSTEFP